MKGTITTVLITLAVLVVLQKLPATQSLFSSQKSYFS